MPTFYALEVALPEQLEVVHFFFDVFGNLLEHVVFFRHVRVESFSVVAGESLRE